MQKVRRSFGLWALALPCVAMIVVYTTMPLAQQKPATGTAAVSAEAPEVATRFSEVLRPKNAKGTVVALKVEMKQWRLSRSDQAFAMPDQGFYLAHLISGEITTEIDGKSVAHHPGDFWVVEKGQRMAISMQLPHESAVLQTVALNPGH